ncbi:hypothetical protein ACVWZV_008029 [Bradyrhizobium sp. GM5.1]
MPGDPQQFWRGESRHRLVACRGPQGGPAPLQLGAFRKGPSVIPENAGPQRPVAGVEQRRAVHLAGQADALDLGQLARVIRLQRVQRRERRLDPLCRVLLAMAGTRRGDRQ